jgi:murein tripeptide amidase MpaA
MSSEYEYEKVIDLTNVPFMDVDGYEAVNTAMSRNKGKLALVRVGENQFPVF